MAMAILNFLVVPAVLSILLSVVILGTVSGQVDIPLEDVGDGTGNDTVSETDTSGFGLDQITLKTELEPHENEFLADDGYREIKKFGFVASNSSEICPSNDCKYGVEEGQFNPSFSGGGYTFEGRLKVTTEEGDAKKSKFHNFSIDLEKMSEEEVDGETTESLEGTFALGDLSYDVTNATLVVDDNNPVLTIQGER